MLADLFKTFQCWRHRRRYKPGVILTRFIACDIRRDVKVVEVSDLDSGYITAQIRTWNVLYAVKGLEPKPDFAEPRRVRVDDLWEWSGAGWGGPVSSQE